jgi:hypothetical protein
VFVFRFLPSARQIVGRMPPIGPSLPSACWPRAGGSRSQPKSNELTPVEMGHLLWRCVKSSRLDAFYILPILSGQLTLINTHL